MSNDSDLARVSINIPKEMLLQIDDYAAKLNINRTSSIKVLLSTAITGLTAMETLKELNEKANKQEQEKLAENGTTAEKY